MLNLDTSLQFSFGCLDFGIWAMGKHKAVRTARLPLAYRSCNLQTKGSVSPWVQLHCKQKDFKQLTLLELKSSTFASGLKPKDLL